MLRQSLKALNVDLAALFEAVSLKGTERAEQLDVERFVLMAPLAGGQSVKKPTPKMQNTRSNHERVDTAIFVPNIEYRERIFKKMVDWQPIQIGGKFPIFQACTSS